MLQARAFDAKRRVLQRVYAKNALDRWQNQTYCPQNDKLCSQSVRLAQTMFLGS
jgi:hypothetical protein